MTEKKRASLTEQIAFTRKPYQDVELDWNELLDGDDLETWFGEEPETLLVANGAQRLAATDYLPDPYGPHEALVILGNLEVDGLLNLDVSDRQHVVVVQGDLKAKHLSIQNELHLIVSGDVEVSGTLLVDISDGGRFLAKGTVSAERYFKGSNGEPDIDEDALPAPEEVDDAESLLEELRG